MMKYRRSIQVGGMLLLITLLLGLSASPVSAASQSSRNAARSQDAATSINATFYLATATLMPMFQQRISQQVPGAMNSAITGMVSKLPAVDRNWAYQMATALIQPSATLTGLAPQQGGLATSLRLSLYPGDSKPINASLLIQFSVLNSSTVQVSAEPLNGSPALASGPMTTFSIPLGQLNSVRTTPGCGSAALAVGLRFPVALSQGQGAPQSQQLASTSTGLGIPQQATSQEQRAMPEAINSYVEIPAASLSSMGGSIGSIPINSSLSAQNIQITVQNSQIVISSDIMLGSLQVGTATTYVEPLAAQGNLAVHVLHTDLTILQIITFPDNTYNQQIQQMLNSKLNGALAGKLDITGAQIGPNSQLPCAASNSLVLTGASNLM